MQSSDSELVGYGELQIAPTPKRVVEGACLSTGTTICLAMLLAGTRCGGEFRITVRATRSPTRRRDREHLKGLPVERAKT